MGGEVMFLKALFINTHIFLVVPGRPRPIQLGMDLVCNVESQTPGITGTGTGILGYT